MFAKICWALMLLLVSVPVMADEEARTKSLSGELTVDWDHDCDSIVDTVTEVSEERLDANGYSLVQIRDRETVLQSETEVDCSGVALTDRGKNVPISYGAYVDSESDWLFYWEIK